MAFTDPIVANEELVRASIRSSNYDPTDPLSVGWQINRDGTATFSNVNVKGIASGPAASYNAVAANNSFTYKGTELQTILDLFSKGIIAYYARTTSAPTVAVRVEQGVARLSLNGKAGRVYRIYITGGLYVNGGTAEVVQALVKSTTSGVDPTYASPVLQQTALLAPAGGYVVPFYIERVYKPTQDETLKLLLTMQGLTGTSTYAMYADPTYPVIMAVYDVGSQLPPAGSDYTGSPKTLKEWTITANSSKTYLGSGAWRTDNVYIDTMIMGDWANGKGNQRGWWTFSNADIANFINDLNGVPLTDIDTLEVRLNPVEWKQNTTQDGYLSLGYHNTADSLPGSVEPGGGIPNAATYYTIGNGTYWYGIKPGGGVPTSFTDALRTGVLKGFMVGNTFGGAQYCGILAGALMANPPRLHAKYYK